MAVWSSWCLDSLAPGVAGRLKFLAPGVAGGLKLLAPGVAGCLKSLGRTGRDTEVNRVRYTFK